MSSLSAFPVPGIVFLLTLISGLWLSRSGKPLNTAIFTIHKLVALAAVVATAIQTYNTIKNTDVQPVVITLLIAAGLGVVALFATGALMSMNKPSYGVFLAVHRVAPLPAVIAMILALYLHNATP